MSLFRRTPSASTVAPTPLRHANAAPVRLEVDAFATSRIVLERLVPIVGTHPYPLSELMLMAAAFYDRRPTRVIDIGTHHGKSARIWHELAQLLDTPPPVHTIDLCDPAHPEFPGKDHGRYCRNLPGITLHTGDGAETAATLIQDDPDAPTLIFLDGDHARATVERELAVCAGLTHASLLLHDTLHQPASGYNEGPYEAIAAFLAANVSAPDSPNAWECHNTHLGLPGMTLLRRAPREVQR